MNESTLVPREDMSDLDWLARNVHKWVQNELLRMKPCDNGNGKIRASWCYSGDGGFTKDQWLSRRAELQNKPSWGAHEYKVIAQGRNGSWYGSNCSEEKFGHERSFCITGTGWKYICDGVDLGDWRDTLEKRPPEHKHSSRLSPESVDKIESVMNRNEAEFVPFVSVEDAATAKRHDPVNSPSHYASGGIECIEAIKASMSHEAFLGYLKGNVQKYMWRYEKKVNPSEDLKKAQWYLSKLIEEQE